MKSDAGSAQQHTLYYKIATKRHLAKNYTSFVVQMLEKAPQGHLRAPFFMQFGTWFLTKPAHAKAPATGISL